MFTSGSRDLTWLIITNALLGVAVAAILLTVIGAGIREIWSHRRARDHSA